MRGISVLLSISLLTGSKLSSQVSIFVDNTYQHEILADSLSGKKIIINQKTFDIKGTRLLFEINYDYQTTLEKNFIACFYDSLNRMISKEIQTIDRIPIQLFRISYDENNDTSSIKVFIPENDTVAISHIDRYYYDSQKRLKEIKRFDAHDRLLENQLFTYKKDNMKPASETVHKYDQGSCKQKYVFSFTDTTGLLTKVRIIDGCKTTTYRKYSVEYDYNPRNKIVAERKVMNNGKVIRQRIYEYTNDIELSTFYDVNDKNEITAFYSRTYFWHKISYLNVKSYFD